MMPTAPEALARLAAIMARLRDPDRDCEWDRVQTFATIAPYTIEEAYEVMDAIERGDMPGLAEELGDLQLQIVYHARIAEEAGAFDLAAVIEGIADKMERRHPHIFGDAAEAPEWEAMKAKERGDTAKSGALDGVALALPALHRAQKIQVRAAGAGFDWPDPEGPRAKIAEELEELDQAEPGERQFEEIGDLLFSIVNLARHFEIDAEQALRKSTARFERRFAEMEASSSKPMTELNLIELESLWQQAKTRLSARESCRSA